MISAHFRNSDLRKCINYIQDNNISASHCWPHACITFEDDIDATGCILMYNGIKVITDIEQLIEQQKL